jgi:hypothetical protein
MVLAAATDTRTSLISAASAFVVPLSGATRPPFTASKSFAQRFGAPAQNFPPYRSV